MEKGEGNVYHNDKKQEEYYEAELDVPKEEDIDVNAQVEDEEETFVCPLSSCTFMTTSFSDEVTLDHYKSVHPQITTTDVKFMRL